MKSSSSIFTSHAVKGTLLIIAGVLLFLYTLGIIERGINVVVMLIALAMVLFGLMKLGIFKNITPSS